MLVRARETVRREAVKEKGAKKAYIRWLITREDGAPNFAMREIEVAPGGCTPYHSHPWEHEIYGLEGVGIIMCKGGWQTTIGRGSVVFIPGGDEHNIRNEGRETLRFLCLIPHPPE